MRPRPRQLAFALASLCVIAALAAVTVQALRLERNELRSRAIAEHEASVRLVLWRMDSMLAPILAREAATPYYHYRPFFEASRTNEPPRDLASARAGKAGTGSEIADALIPSPLLQSDSKLVNLYFEVDADGLRSPQAPQGEARKLAESNFVSAYRIETNVDRLNRLETVWNRSADAWMRPATGRSDSEAIEMLADSGRVMSVPGVAAPPGEMARADVASNQNFQQQLGNDYAQRAQVAMNSKLTQLEAERSASQWRRGEDPAANEAPRAGGGEASTGADAGPKVEDGESRGVGGGSGEDAAGGVSDEARSTASAVAPITSRSGARGQGEHNDAPNFDLGVATELDAQGRSRDRGAARREGRVHDPAPTDAIQVDPTRVDPVQGPLEPRWLVGSDEPTLVLVRLVTTSAGPITQGLWLNWPELRGALLELAADVFPNASIDPLPGGVADLPPEALNRCLATIPAELRVEAPAIPAPRVLTPVRVALSLAWVVALGAIAASGLALRSATELAERRGQFVSAVTHELRTPLTTFCLYSQMLADGMVRDADAQAQYHSTLHRESQRLTRIVESVLEYARLGKRKAHARPEATSVAALLDASIPALRDRSHGCGLELVEAREGDMGGAIRVDRATFDRILSNLVDNACKYAVGSEPARVELVARVSASTLEIRVRDYGPGIPALEARRIFDPFFRGSAHSDGATPGLGLGLALCKALAREMGGDLSLIQPEGGAGGACFRLALPRNA